MPPVSSQKTVSIVITCHNYGHYLEDCLRSVLQQSFSAWDALIVDDGSSDNSPEVAARLTALDPRIQYLRTENQGVSRARNLGIERLTGEYVLALDADDMLPPRALERLLARIQEDPKFGFAYGALEMLNILPAEPTTWRPGPYSISLLRCENVACVSSLWPRRLFEQGVRFRDGFFYEDWDLWLQIAERGFTGGYVPHTVLQCRAHLDGRTSFAKYHNFQGLAQQILGSPKLFHEPSYHSFAQTILLKAPASLHRPSFLFLVPVGQADPLYVQKVYRWAEQLVEIGHLVSVFGDLPQQLKAPPGVYTLHFGGKYDPERVEPFFSKLGSNVIVLSRGWEPTILWKLKQEPQISLLLGIGEDIEGLAEYALHEETEGLTLVSHALESAQTRRSFYNFTLCGLELSAIAERLGKAKHEAQRAERQRLSTLSRSTSFAPSTNSGYSNLSVIIPVRNVEGARLRRCLQSIRANDCDPKLPIVVSDFGSCTEAREQTAEICRELGAEHLYTPTREAWSRPRALNIGARACSTEYLAFSSADTLFGPQFFAMWQQYRATLREDYLLLSQALRLPPAYPYPALWRGSDFEACSASARLIDSGGFGSFQALARKHFETLGGFYERNPQWGKYDHELAFRAQLFGLRTAWLQPQHLVHQWHLSDLDEEPLRQYHASYRANRIALQINLNGDAWGRASEAEQLEWQRAGALPAAPSNSAQSVRAEVLRVGCSALERHRTLLEWGNECLTKKRFHSALITFEELLAFAPDEYNAHMGLAATHYFLQGWQRSAHHAYRVLEHDATHVQARELLSSIRSLMGGYYSFIENPANAHQIPGATTAASSEQSICR